ncbi:MAG: GNAT family N-acetyltransferase [Candidatus Devosia phytovorans]|uniref:GNAT family N-acetyltransferase n=1 Tax=Candidatus Devosia phytovorans TaxID=3121372 RepID=A0AAJ5VSR3_9HYPH|nr:GNAT family N-acetyltransferase [Devosia sp.]WEK03612.1 MAG: GNAT family N-acetyltransferase [Devosia sp.]
MSDLLVRLYDLPIFHAEARVAAAGITVRRAIAPEGHIILGWVGRHFHPAWVSEASKGLAQNPVTTWIATRDHRLLGFACHDTTAKGFFGPTGVDEAERGQGIGEALLIATLKGMREAGYGYAVIGDPGPVAFYTKRLDAMEIPNSKPGIYAGMLRD